MLCRNCGKELIGNENNCPNCGINIKNTNIRQFKTNNKGLKRTKLFLTVFIIIGIISSIALMFTNSARTEITGTEFSSLLTDNGYTVTRNTVLENSAQIEEMYIATKSGSSEEIAYVKVEDSYAEEFYDQLEEHEGVCKSFKINNTMVYAISCEDGVADEAFKIIGYEVRLNIFSILLIISVTVIGILYIASNFKIFEKAGKKGYYCLIPFVSQYCKCDIAFNNKGAAITILSIAMIFVTPVEWIVNFKIGKQFGKSDLFSLGLVVCGLIFFPLLAADDDAVYLRKN